MNTQPEALRLADALVSCVQTYQQQSEDEPGGYCTEADQLMDESAALLRTQHADLLRKDALLRQALETLENHNGNYKLTDAEADVVIAVQDAIKQELAK